MYCIGYCLSFCHIKMTQKVSSVYKNLPFGIEQKLAVFHGKKCLLPDLLPDLNCYPVLYYLVHHCIFVPDRHGGSQTACTRTSGVAGWWSLMMRSGYTQICPAPIGEVRPRKALLIRTQRCFWIIFSTVYYRITFFFCVCASISFVSCLDLSLKTICMSVCVDTQCLSVCRLSVSLHLFI